MEAILKIFSMRDRVRALLLVAGMAIGAALEVIGIGLVVPLIATLTSPQVALDQPILRRVYDWSGLQSAEGFAVLLLACFLGAVVIKNTYLSLLGYLKFRFVYGMQGEVSRRLFIGYLNRSYQAHLGHHSSEATRSLVTEVNNLFSGVIVPLLEVGAEGLVLVFLMILLLIAMPATTIAVLAAGTAIAIGLYSALRGLLARHGKSRAERSGQRIEVIGDALGGLKEIKVLRREPYFMERFNEVNDAYLGASRVFATLNSLPRLVVETLAVVLLAGAAFAVMLTNQNLQTAIPGIVLLCLVALRLMPATTRVVASMASIRFYSPALRQVSADLESVAVVPSSVPQRPPVSPLRISKELELRDIAFSYSGRGASAVSDVNLRIPVGSMCGLVGPSGAGKSTLADLILGVLPPDRGQVLVDGVDIASSREQWMANVGYVPQSVYLLDDSIRRNVAFGVPDRDIDDRRVWRALGAAQMEPVVSSLRGGLDHVIGERGLRISGGQRQRLGIARALYLEPQVLVLDEATSALDAQTERAIVDTLFDMRKERTVIVIAHRLETIRRCERLFYVSEGRLRGVGSYVELVEANASFAQLVGQAAL